MAQKVLEMKNIGKSYFGTQVLKDINITLEAGEIHALAGENGAGKSTLMNILFGMPVIHQTGGFDGEVLINEEPVNLNSPQKAMAAGIGMVHQEFMLLPGFTITENIKLNREITKDNIFSKIFGKSLKTLNFKAMNKDAKKAMTQLGMSIDEITLISKLPVGHMQFVEIAREIDKGDIKLLVFDEPTAVLTENEADKLLDAMEKLSEKGIAILFITHRLDEIMRVADTITILRDGHLVESGKKESFTIETIAEKMVGRKMSKSEMLKRDDFIENASTLLNIENLKVDMPGEKVKNFSLEVKQGEILGIGGLAGGGKIGVSNGIMGLYPSEGNISKNGSPIALNSPVSSLNQKIAFVSEDRRGIGLLLDESIEMNIATTAIQIQDKFLKNSFSKSLSFYDNIAIRKHALELIKELDIRCTGPEQKARSLSGGNQQKVCIARAFTLEPEILFVSEPTRGIDVGAKQIVLDLLVKMNREHGVTIIMTSSELAELRKICDRIAIVAEGELAGILPPDAPDVKFGLMMAAKKEVIHHG